MVKKMQRLLIVIMIIHLVRLITQYQNHILQILCNFYHEKTGQWFTEDWNTEPYSNQINKYYPEFYLKYSDLVDEWNKIEYSTLSKFLFPE